MGPDRVLKARYNPALDAMAHANLWNDVNSLIISPTGPAIVMIDELTSKSQELIARTANWAGPGWGDRWGVFLVNGPAVSYLALNQAPNGTESWPFNAIDQLLLAARCRIGVELYAYYGPSVGNKTSLNWNYVRRPGPNDQTPGPLRPQAERDDWLNQFIMGGRIAYNMQYHRLGWVYARSQGTGSVVHPIIGTIDKPLMFAYMGGDYAPYPARFIDRMMWMIANNSARNTLRDSNGGGVGSWKWETASVESSSRDQAFRESINHYCRPPYNTSYRYGSQLP